MDKKEARKEMLKKRKAFSNLKVSLVSKSIIDQIRALDIYQKAKKVGLYAPILNEISVMELLSDDKEFYFPRVNGDYIHFFLVKSTLELKEGSFNILEPIGNEENDLDLVIVPMVGYTNNNFRIGYGKGYYDRFLRDFQGNKIGVSYKELYIEDVPMDSYDIPLDQIIKEG